MFKRLSFLVLALFINFNISAQTPVQFSFSENGSPTPGSTTYEVDVMVSDFNQLLGAQFAIVWDSMVLEIDTLTFITQDLADFNSGAVSLPSQTASMTRGQLRVSWFSFSTAQTLPNNHRLFTMRFNVLGSACDTTSIALANAGIEILDENTQNVGAEWTPLNVMVPGTDCGGGGGGNEDAVQLIFPDITAENGETVCMPFTTTNFDSVVSFQGSLMWDPAVLSFSELMNFGLPGLNASSFNTMNSGNGMATFVWFDNTGVNPVTLADNEILFEICFDVIGSNGSQSLVKASDMPTSIQVFSEGSGILEHDVVEGSVIVTEDIMPGSTFSIKADTVFADVSDSEVCVDFSTLNFDNIAAMQYTLQWDPAILSYNRVEAVDPEFSNTFNPVGDDRLRYSWSHSLATGLDVADGTVIYRVCFDILGDCDQSTALSFISEPGRPIEISDGNFTPLPASDVMLQNGRVNIACNIILQANINDVRCNGESNGSINLSISGGEEPYTVNWEWSTDTREVTGVLSDLLVGRRADTYSVTVTDDEGATATAEYVISQPDPIDIGIMVSGSMVSTNPTGGNGMIELEFNPTIDDFNNVPEGTYTVLATDSRGCTETEIFVVGAECSDPVDISTVVFSAVCGDDGRIEVNCSGGSGDYTISSNPSLSFDGTAFINVPAGTYTITCVDDNDSACTASTSVQVLQDTPEDLSVDISNIVNVGCNGSLGSFDVAASGGCTPYIITYTVDGGSAQIYNPNGEYEAGDYEVIVTDANADMVSETFTITVLNNSDLDLSFSVENAPCTGMMGEATFEITGNCGPLSCELTTTSGSNQNCNLTDNGDGSFTGLYSIGNYSITFTDDVTGESITQQFSVTASPNALSASVVNVTAMSVNISVQNGVMPYQFFWTDPQGNDIGDITTEDLQASDINGAGLYNVTIIDAMGCSFALTVNVPMVGGLIINVDLINEPFDGFATPCAVGNCMGTISGDVQGGTAPYTITVEGNDGSEFQITLSSAGVYEVDGLCAGAYVATVEDADGTTNTAPGNYIITAPDPIVIEELDSQCPDDGQNNGFISASVSGGTNLGYIYTWSPANNDPVPGPINEDLTTGLYTLNVEDSNGCEEQQTFDLLTDCIDTDCFIGRRVVTPNDDGANDVFAISCADNLGYSLRVFDRWSKLVYSSSNYNNDWNGIDNSGEEAPEGAYYWVLDTGDKIYQGTVTLLRD